MSGNFIFGAAVGAAIGMYVASKNKKVRQVVNETEQMVESKMCTCGQNQAQVQN